MIKLERFSNFLKNQNLLKSKQEIEKKNRQSAFSAKDRVLASTIYHWLGDKKARKLLKSNIDNLEEILNYNEEKLIEFARKTHHLNFLGAYKAAELRYQFLITNNLVQKIETSYPQIYSSIGSHYMQTFNYAKALGYYKQAQNKMQPDTAAYLFSIISQVDCLVGLKSYAEALELLLTTENMSKKSSLYFAMYLQVLGDLQVRMGSSEIGIKTLRESQNLFLQEKLNNKDYAYCLLSLSIAQLQLGEKESAKKDLKKAYEILSGPDHSPLSMINLSLVNKHFDLGIIELNDYYKLRADDFKFTYQDLVPLECANLATSSAPSIPQEKALYYLNFAGRNGLFEGFLLEKIYENSIFSELEKDKLKKLIKRVRDRGHQIKKLGGFYTLSFDNQR